jgi:exo-beta-1,3-glucanase (GH17 family)
MRLPVLVLALAAAALVHYAAWWLPNRPVEIPPMPTERLQSVSFAPFRDGQSPLEQVYPSPAQIEEDLRLVARQAEGIRTYTVREGLEVVPDMARRIGLEVTAGAWIGRLPARNGPEVDELIRQARAHPDVIRRVIVGNEVLLRRDRTPEELAAYIRRVRDAVDQPVGYADVWENFVRFPAIAEEVDFLVIHILPYWEDVPGSIEHVRDHVLWAYRQVRARWPDKPIMIGETGWPTEGRARGPASPGKAEKALFLAEFAALAESESFDYNVIEAFDQRWKERLEGTVGARWGLMGADRSVKFEFGRPVVENPDWRLHAAAGTLLAVGLLLPALWGRRLAARDVALLAVAAQAMGGALVWASLVAMRQNFVVHQIAEAWALVALQAVVALAAVHAAAARLSGDAPRVSPHHRAEARPGLPLAARVGRPAFLALAAWAAYAGLALTWDGRYRNFAVQDLVVPAAAVALLGIARLRLRGPGDPWWTALSLGHLFADTWPMTAGPRRSILGAARVAPVTAAVALCAVVGAVGVVLREGWLQGLGLEAILRVSREVGFQALAFNGVNWEAMAHAALTLAVAVPAWAALAHLRAGAALTDRTRTAPAAGARGWDSQG